MSQPSAVRFPRGSTPHNWAFAQGVGGPELADATLSGLAALSQLLNTRPDATTVAGALLAGPLTPYAATGVILLIARGESLAMLGWSGYSPEETAGFETIPIDADFPISQAYRESEVIITSSVASAVAYAGLAEDPDRWSRMQAERPMGSIVSAPVLSQGIGIGAFGFSCSVERAWSTLDVALLNGLSALLGMWMTLPETGLDTDHTPYPVCVPALTPRQRDMLALVASGLTTAEIARELAYSESTVKQELQRAMRLLNATDRQGAVQRARELGIIPGGDA
jgi:DNA-binding CsgD family transcriptional regulator